MATAIQTNEPPSCSNHFLVGRNEQGRWIVCDEQGLVGGIFVSRDAAIHFAREESNFRPGAVICVPENQAATLDRFLSHGNAEPQTTFATRQ